MTTETQRAQSGKDGRPQPPPRRVWRPALPGPAVAPPRFRSLREESAVGGTPTTTGETPVLPIPQRSAQSKSK